MTSYCSIQDVKDCFVATLPEEFTDAKITDLIAKSSIFIDNYLGQAVDTQDVEDACALLVAARIALALYPENNELYKNYRTDGMATLKTRKDKLRAGVIID